MSLSAFSAMAVSVATSSSVQLKTSPVGEKPIGDSSTTSSSSRRLRMPSASILRTSPVCLKSTPFTTPTGFAVTKFPEDTRMSAPHMGLLASSIDSSASISTRTMPLASFTQASALSSVTRRPPTYTGVTPCWRICSSICGRVPWTSTTRTSRLTRTLMSWVSCWNSPSASTSPPKAITNVAPPHWWI
jgi:hypothetical protein